MDTYTAAPETQDRRSASSPQEERGRRRRRLFGRIYRKPTSQSTWYIRYPDPERQRAPNGRVREIVRSVPTRRAAEALLAEVRKALYSGSYEPPPLALAPGLVPRDAAEGGAGPPAGSPAFTVLDAIDQYIEAKRNEGRAPKTVRRYESNRTALSASALGVMPAAEVTPEDVEAYRAWRRERVWRASRRLGSKATDPILVAEVQGTATNATINRDLLLLSAAYNRLVRLRRISENPVARVGKAKEVRKTRAVLSKAEARALMDACSESLRPLVVAGLFTGARLGELTRLTWGDIHFDRETLDLFRPKVGNASAIPLHPVLAEELRRLRADRARAGNRVIPDTEAVFLSNRGTAWVTFRRAWALAVKAAGLEGRGLVYHSLRHTFACHFLEGGAAITDLQAVLGHADIGTTQLYATMVDSRTRASVAALDYGTSGRRIPARRAARKRETA